MKHAVANLTTIFTELFERDEGSTARVDAEFVDDAEDELDKLFGS
jgi:hypothetical protein